MALNDIGIDLGTTSIIIAMEGKGVVLNQPSIVAVDTRQNKVLAVGDDALAMVGRTPSYISAISPLKDGVISDHMLTRELICRFIRKVNASRIKPRVAVCVPAAITGIESDAVVEAVIAAGARQVYLIDEPLAAALGSDIDITAPEGHMIVDIGGGTTDIAVISLGGKVKSTSVNVAGNTFDDEILKYIRVKFNIAIGQRMAESLKKQVACCPELDFHGEMEIKGRSLITGLPQRLTITTDDLYEPVCMLVEQIGTAAHQVLEKTPPELAGDIYSQGIMLTGGGAQLKGLPEYMSKALKVKTRVSPDPVNCVALGTSKSLSMETRLETGFVDATPHLSHFGRR
ncbi:MAG: rod shape-determining protein [Subdoligranulum sp.]|nr:rod shape-determining protein [Subdoligranulum sp.]MCI7542145.1 rod shape-determining protein [Subdoligranulum sp.]MDD7265724.1 rod shape-determining protein [Subdoligranulum sp.]MDY5922669.1 rod shape-determining protein [Oscillospiraceae bacterium]